MYLTFSKHMAILGSVYFHHKKRSSLSYLTVQTFHIHGHCEEVQIRYSKYEGDFESVSKIYFRSDSFQFTCIMSKAATHEVISSDAIGASILPESLGNFGPDAWLVSRGSDVKEVNWLGWAKEPLTGSNTRNTETPESDLNCCLCIESKASPILVNASSPCFIDDIAWNGD